MVFSTGSTEHKLEMGDKHNGKITMNMETNFCDSQKDIHVIDCANPV